MEICLLLSEIWSLDPNCNICKLFRRFRTVQDYFKLQKTPANISPIDYIR